MVEVLRGAILRLLQVQGAITLLLVVGAPRLLLWMGLPPDLAPLMRICLLAALCQVFLLFAIVVLLYFDWQREAAAVSVFFFATNAAFTAVGFLLPDMLQGYGYFASCLVSLLLALGILNSRIAELEYETFMKQPLSA